MLAMYLFVSATNPLKYNTTMATTAHTNALYVDISALCSRGGAA